MRQTVHALALRTTGCFELRMGIILYIQDTSDDDDGLHGLLVGTLWLGLHSKALEVLARDGYQRQR